MTWTRRVPTRVVMEALRHIAPRNVLSLLLLTPAFCRLKLRLIWHAERYMSSLYLALSHSTDIIPGSLRQLDVVACPSHKAPHPSLLPPSSTPPWHCNQSLPPSPILHSTTTPRYVTLTSSVRSTHNLTLYECRHAPHALPLPSSKCRLLVSSARPESYMIRYAPPKFFTPNFAPNFAPNSRLIHA